MNDLSRRQLLTLVSAGIPIGLAGCSENGTTTTATDSGDDGSTDTGGGDTDTGTTAQGSPKSVELKLPPIVATGDDINFNKAGNNSNFTMNQTIHQMFGQPMIDGDIATPWFEDFTIGENNKSLTVTVNEKGTWSNGDDVTGEDLWFTMEWARIKDPEASNLESVEQIDEYTVKWTTKQKFKDVTFRLNWNVGLNQGCHMHPGTYMEWMEKFQDATTQEERNKINTNLQETQMDYDEVPKSGPFQIEEFRPDGVKYSVRDNYFVADQLDFIETATQKFIGSEDVKAQLITNGDVDVGWNTPLNKNLEGSVPNGYENVDTWGNGRALQFIFNFNNEHLSHRKFRQAIAHLMDIDQIVTNIRASGDYANKVPGRQCGLLEWQMEEWLGDLTGELHDYGRKSKPEKAAQQLEDIGYSKQGENWVDPDGNELELTLRSPTWMKYANSTRTFNSQLNSFGIGTKLLVTESGTYYPKVMEQYQFDIAVGFYGYGRANTHPVTNYAPNHELAFNLGGSPSAVVDLSEERDTVEGVGKPYELTIPSEPGSLEVSGDGQQINLAELVSELNSPLSKEREKEIVQTLARYFNFELAQVLHVDEVAGIWANHADYAWPSSEEELRNQVRTKRPGPFMVRNGYIGAKYE